jgi:hypothetical protein
MKPKHVGSWIAACTPQQDLIKWGQRGDTKFPFKPGDLELQRQLLFLTKSPVHKEDRFYVLDVFSNGQMKTSEVDRPYSYVKPSTGEVVR